MIKRSMQTDYLLFIYQEPQIAKLVFLALHIIQQLIVTQNASIFSIHVDFGYLFCWRNVLRR